MSIQQHTDFNLGSGKASEIHSAYQAAEDTFRVLDLGCGSAQYHESMEETFEQMGEKEVEIIGLDYDMENLLNGDTEGKVYANAAQEAGETFMPFQDESFDLVYSNHLFCQLEKEENYEELFNQVEDGAERVLKDSGVQFHEC